MDTLSYDAQPEFCMLYCNKQDPRTCVCGRDGGNCGRQAPAPNLATLGGKIVCLLEFLAVGGLIVIASTHGCGDRDADDEDTMNERGRALGDAADARTPPVAMIGLVVGIVVLRIAISARGLWKLCTPAKATPVTLGSLCGPQCALVELA